MKEARVAIAAVITVMAAAMVVLAAPRPFAWGGWRPATCFPDHCFCERIREQLVRQPSNAVSGVAFIGVAALVLLSIKAAAGDRNSKSVMGSHTVYPALYAFASLVIGAGTVFYHASLTFWGQTADVFGMYLIATFLVLHNLAPRLSTMRAIRAAILYILANTLLFAGLLAVPTARRYAFGVLIAIALVLEIVARRKRLVATSPMLFVAALAAFALGFLIWTLDITRTVCAPDSLLQGHAVWHLAGALAVWLMFLYLRREPVLP